MDIKAGTEVLIKVIILRREEEGYIVITKRGSRAYVDSADIIVPLK